MWTGHGCFGVYTLSFFRGADPGAHNHVPDVTFQLKRAYTSPIPRIAEAQGFARNFEC